MRWENREGSSNIDDRRASSGGKRIGGIGGILLTAVITYFMSGGDMGAVLNSVISNSLSSSSSSSTHVSHDENRNSKFVAVVLKDTEDVWGALLPKYGIRYKKPVLVMYRGHTSSGCGGASSAMGPFYCPLDQKVYLDLSFFDELKEKFGAKGDFAEAYVIAHEVGHHVQNLLGVLSKVEQQKRFLSKKDANALSVKTELQADCFAGVWARYDNELHQILQEGDIQEALHAANQIGDDTLQKNTQGYAVPDSFTHGSSKQRQKWFYQGFNTGDLNACNTFKLIR